MISYAESMTGDTPGAFDIEDTETGPREGLFLEVYTGILTGQMIDLYDDLEDWYCDGDESLGTNFGESMV